MIIRNVKGFICTNGEFRSNIVDAYASEYRIIYNIAEQHLLESLGKQFNIGCLMEHSGSVKATIQEMDDNHFELIQEALSLLNTDEYKDFVDRMQKIDGDLQAL